MNSTVKGPNIAEPESWGPRCPTAHTRQEDGGLQGPLEFMDPTNDEALEFAIRPYEIETPENRAGLLLAQINSVATARRMNSHMNSTVKGPNIAEPESWGPRCPTAHTRQEDGGLQGPLEFMDPTNDEALEFAIRPYEIETPENRAGLLLAQINSVATARRMNSINMHAIEVDAHALVAADAPGAHGALGALAALRGKDEDVRVHYRIVLENARDSAVPYLNYSIALLQVGDSTKAHRMALEAEKRTRKGDLVLPHLIMTAFESGHFREALMHCERWRAVGPEIRPPHYCGPAQTIADAIEQGMLSEEATAQALRIANRVRGAANVRPAATALYRDMRQPGEFRYRIDVHTTRQHAQDLSAAVATRIAGAGPARDTGTSTNTLEIIFVATQ